MAHAIVDRPRSWADDVAAGSEASASRAARERRAVAQAERRAPESERLDRMAVSHVVWRVRTNVLLALALSACAGPTVTPEPGAGEAGAAAPTPARVASISTEPTATAPAATVDASSVANASAAVQCALDAPALAQYLHPEVRGRVPVRVRLPAEVVLVPLPRASGASIEIVTSNALLDVGALRLEGGTATMQVAIDAEGVFGEVVCTRATDGWSPTNVALHER